MACYLLIHANFLHLLVSEILYLLPKKELACAILSGESSAKIESCIDEESIGIIRQFPSVCTNL
jgi:hypothetical protein